jgi:hypothetical protein
MVLIHYFQILSKSLKVIVPGVGHIGDQTKPNNNIQFQKTVFLVQNKAFCYFAAKIF